MLSIILCRTCGNAYPSNDDLPQVCPICADDRQYLLEDGQVWLDVSEIAGDHRFTLSEPEPGVTRIDVTPDFGIGQKTMLVNTPAGNLLWEPSGYIDDDLLQTVTDRGGVAAVASSHPHLVGASVVWAREFAAPFYFNTDDRRWITHPDPSIELWRDSRQILPGLTLVQAGGHFPGSSVAHWAVGADDRGVLFCGDTIAVVANRTASFMRSYPNSIPLSPRLVRQIVDAVEPYDYDRIYGAFGSTIDHDARRIVHESADRYIAWVTDAIRDPDERSLVISPVS
ncbi:MBL fold metallo-hydrolase [Microlunatus sp. Gsoil 973]|uniref:MBL fold metallo-hydrolase n=1 Tax=Microlunatus sp. Gsoil 973 TaxID=2672569 RepID=UPI0012B4766E|nr:MBL fold metallo-hydrolase [Microlunatus sp. Gsoil 973]QGN33456.1 MBL fold metallo-hydrolase [Microlunatus sp. Gsoil 973]